jgi:hypothetical protein
VYDENYVVYTSENTARCKEKTWLMKNCGVYDGN